MGSQTTKRLCRLKVETTFWLQRSGHKQQGVVYFLVSYHLYKSGDNTSPFPLKRIECAKSSSLIKEKSMHLLTHYTFAKFKQITQGDQGKNSEKQEAQYWLILKGLLKNDLRLQSISQTHKVLHSDSISFKECVFSASVFLLFKKNTPFKRW